MVHEQAARAGLIVQNLLTFARKETPEATGVDLNTVVERTALLVAYDLRLRAIELDQKLSTEEISVKGNRYELQQVLLNLLTNATHAISRLHPDAARRITVETLRDGTQAVLRVRDTGPGVPQQLVSQLFTPFFTTKDPGEGTGLGLSISYGIVESHGGRLSYAPACWWGQNSPSHFPTRLRGEKRRRFSPPTSKGCLGEGWALHSRGGFGPGSPSYGGGTLRHGWSSRGQRADRRRSDAARAGREYDLVLADSRATMNGEGFVTHPAGRATRVEEPGGSHRPGRFQLGPVATRGIHSRGTADHRPPAERRGAGTARGLVTRFLSPPERLESDPAVQFPGDLIRTRHCPEIPSRVEHRRIDEPPPSREKDVAGKLKVGAGRIDHDTVIHPVEQIAPDPDPACSVPPGCPAPPWRSCCRRSGNPGSAHRHPWR